MATKITHDKLADKNVLSPLIKEFNELIKVSEKATESLKKTKKELDGKKAIEGAKDLKKLSDATKEITKNEKTLIDTSKKLNKLQNDSIKAIKDKNKSRKDLNQTNQKTVDLAKKIEAEEKKLSALNSNKVQDLTQLKRLSAEQNKINKDTEILNAKNVGTLQKLNAQNRVLRRERESLNLNTEKGRKRLQAINKELDKNNKFIKENSDKLKQQNLNVGNYSESIKEAAASSGLFGGIIGRLTTVKTTYNAILKATTAGTGKLTKAQKALNIVVKASPLFLLVGALGGLISFFTRSQKGVDSLSNAFAGLTTGLDVVIDRFSIVGEGLADIFSGDIVDGLDKIKNAFSGIGDELEREIKLSTELNELTIKLTREQKLFEAQQASNLTRVKELTVVVKDKLRADQERLDAVKEINEIEIETAERQLDLQKQALAASLDSISADKDRLELGDAQLDFINRIKEGTIEAAEAVQLAADFTLSSAAGEEALFEVVEKVVAQEQARQSLLEKQSTTAKRTASITKEIANKRSTELAREAAALRQISKDETKSIEDRIELLEKAAEQEIKSFDVRAKANIINEQEVANARLQINAKLAQDIAKLRKIELPEGPDFEAIAKKQVKTVNDIEQELLNQQITNIDRRLQVEELSNSERIRLINERAETEKKQAQAQSEFIIATEDKTAEEIELINLKLEGELKSIDEERLDAVKSVNDKIKEDDKKTNEARRAENRKLINDIGNETLSALAKQSDEKAKLLNQEVTAAQESVKQQERIAAEGGENILAQERERLAKVQLEQQRAAEERAKQEQALALALAFVNSFASYSEEDPKTALGKALKDTFLAKGIAKIITGSFYEGTEDTGTTANPMDSKGGRLVMVHDNERIMSKAQNEMTKGMSNDELAKLAQDYHNGNTWSFMPTVAQMSDNSEVVTKLDQTAERIENALKKYQSQQVIDGDSLGRLIDTRIKGTFKQKFIQGKKHRLNW